MKYGREPIQQLRVHLSEIQQLTMHYGCLQMWSNYHVNPPAANIKPHTIHMKVALLGYSEGTMPTSVSDMAAGKGAKLKNSLDPRLKQNNYKSIKDMLNVFTRYITASTNGILNVDVEFIELSNYVGETYVSKVGKRQSRSCR